MAAEFYVIDIHPDRMDPTKPNFIGGAADVPLPVQQMDTPNYPNILHITPMQPAKVNQLDVQGRWPPATIGPLADYVDRSILRVYDTLATAFLTGDAVRALI